MREELPRTDGPGPDPDDDPPEHHFGHRHEVWGDDPEEIVASQVVEEFAADEEVQRRWHDHAAFVPIKVVARFIRQSGKRIAVTIAGFTVLIVGIAMLALPGPGLVMIIVGLGILSSEYVWAQRLLRKAKEKAEQAKDVVLRRNNDGEVDGDDAEKAGDADDLVEVGEAQPETTAEDEADATS
jgi:uncharacterized protein (TIGR02611 family)